VNCKRILSNDIGNMFEICKEKRVSCIKLLSDWSMSVSFFEQRNKWRESSVCEHREQFDVVYRWG